MAIKPTEKDRVERMGIVHVLESVIKKVIVTPCGVELVKTYYSPGTSPGGVYVDAYKPNTVGYKNTTWRVARRDELYGDSWWVYVDVQEAQWTV